jgi:Zn finger protein HypA/HybF involved in hydrogenase expression
MDESLKCLHCGHEYTMPLKPKQEVQERICPKCKSNSVRKLPAQK